MRILIQEGPDTVRQAATLEGVDPAGPEFFVVDLADPDQEELDVVAGAFKLPPTLLAEHDRPPIAPKLQEHRDFLYITWGFLKDLPDEGRLEASTTGIVIGANYIIFIHPGAVSEIDSAMIKLVDSPDIYNGNAGNLLYAVLDNAAEAYFPIVEQLTASIERFLDRTLAGDEDCGLENLLELKHRNMSVRRLIVSHRDIVMKLLRHDMVLISSELSGYLIEVYDHLSTVNFDVDANSDLISAALDIHLNMVSNGMNVTMEKLTTIATVFLPLTFIVGVYGMNFRIPEFEWQYGYLFAWVLIAVSTVVMLLVARKRDWF